MWIHITETAHCAYDNRGILGENSYSLVLTVQSGIFKNFFSLLRVVHFGVTRLQDDKILSYNACSKTRVYQIHERDLESVIKNMQCLDLFSCHYASLCEISVSPTALVALVFLHKCAAKSKAVVGKGCGHKMAGKNHRERARVKNNSVYWTHPRTANSWKSNGKNRVWIKGYMKQRPIWQY